MKYIPKIIQDTATEQGFNSVEFIGRRKGAQAFLVGLVDDDGFAPPIGLPTVYLLKDEKITIKSGEDALNLL